MYKTIRPGKVLYDTDGRVVQAHGGSICRFNRKNPPVLPGVDKNTLVNKNLDGIIVKVWQPHHKGKIPGGF